MSRTYLPALAYNNLRVYEHMEVKLSTIQVDCTFRFPIAYFCSDCTETNSFSYLAHVCFCMLYVCCLCATANIRHFQFQPTTRIAVVALL